MTSGTGSMTDRDHPLFQRLLPGVADLAVDHIETIGDREHVTIAVLTLIDA